MQLLFMLVLPVLFCVCMPIIFSACTLSFQNVSTHGVADDLIDDDQAGAASPTISPDISIPLKAM